MLKQWREIYFTPEDNARAILLNLPGHAQKTIDVEAYSLTDLAFADELIDASQRGIAVRVMTDRSQSEGVAQRGVLEKLAAAGIPVRIVESTHGALDHQKVLIIDGALGPLHAESVVAYGSFNFSQSAQLQDNVLVVTNHAEEVAAFLEKFERDWAENIQKPEWQIEEERDHAIRSAEHAPGDSRGTGA